ncbi:MAG: cytochrome c [Candidatus Kapaibacterium sp.]
MGKYIIAFRLFVIFGVASSTLFITSCNIKGFFTKQGDDPVWVDPNAKKDVVKDGDVPGQALFGKNCAACHGAAGKGLPGAIPPLAGSAMANDADATKPIRIVLHGFKGEIERNGQKINGVMAAWKSNFDDQQIAEILSYVRTSWGNTGGAITADQVKDVREKTKSRNGAMTEPELQQPL